MVRLTLFVLVIALTGAAYGDDTPVITDPSTPITVEDQTTPTPSSDATNTTTAATTTSLPTTTAAPATTTVAPIKDSFYRVTDNNVTCIMYSGDVHVDITYPIDDKTTKTVKVKVPAREDADKENVKVTGSCNMTDTGAQFIKISWGSTNKMSSMELMFNKTGDDWKFVATQFEIFMDDKTFPNATDEGSFLNSVGTFPGLTNVPVKTNRSLTCRAFIKGSNFTAQVENSTKTYTVEASAVGAKIQAFNMVPNTSDLRESTRCEADMTSDLVPIAVGCALAGLVLLVLISYLVGRRRRAAAYQSV